MFKSVGMVKEQLLFFTKFSSNWSMLGDRPLTVDVSALEEKPALVEIWGFSSVTGPWESPAPAP